MSDEQTEPTAEQREHIRAVLSALAVIALPNDATISQTFASDMGYTGACRFVAFWWERIGDELAWSDGWQTQIGAQHWNWRDFWLMVDPIPPLSEEDYRSLVKGEMLESDVQPFLNTLKLGSSDEAAENWLLLDRATHRLYQLPAVSGPETLKYLNAVDRIFLYSLLTSFMKGARL